MAGAGTGKGDGSGNDSTQPAHLSPITITQTWHRERDIEQLTGKRWQGRGESPPRKQLQDGESYQPDRKLQPQFMFMRVESCALDTNRVAVPAPFGFYFFIVQVRRLRPKSRKFSLGSSM